MKGYYITYGIFTNKLEVVVKDLEQELNIQLIKQDNIDELDNEIYYLNPTSEKVITDFSITKSTKTYHLTEKDSFDPNYLISCNITSEKDECVKEEYIQFLRRVLNKKVYLKELCFDVDEW